MTKEQTSNNPIGTSADIVRTGNLADEDRGVEGDRLATKADLDAGVDRLMNAVRNRFAEYRENLRLMHEEDRKYFEEFQAWAEEAYKEDSTD